MHASLCVYCSSYPPTHPPTLPKQNAIYFLCAPNRELAEASPYFETFKRTNKEVRTPPTHPPIPSTPPTHPPTHPPRSSSCTTPLTTLS